MMMKKWICLLLACLIGTQTALAVNAGTAPNPPVTFTDVPADAWYIRQLETLVARGAISGYADGSFAPDATMTVAEYIRLLVSCTVPEQELAAYETGGSWPEKYLQAGNAIGALKGFDCSQQRIAKPVTRAEAAWLLSAFARYGGESLTVPDGIGRAVRDYKTVSETYREAVGMACGAGLLTADSAGNFQPSVPLRRCEAAVSAVRLLYKEQRPLLVLPDYDYAAPAPASAPVEDSFFSDAVFIGDSLCDGFGAFSGLTQGTFMGVTSLNVYTVWNGGREQVFQTQKFGKIYIMLGINEIGYGTEKVAAKYKEMVQKFQSLQPQADIYVQSLLPVCESKTSASDRRNHVSNYYVRELNTALQTVCEECQVYFVNLHEAFADASGGLPAGKCWDAVHLNVPGYKEWLAYLRTHTVG